MYKVIIYTPQELNHSSYIQTGLFELEAQGLITVDIQLHFQSKLGRYAIEEEKLIDNMKPHPKTSFYELIDTTTGKKISFATDLYDFADQFSKVALDHCDYVFKRSYEARYVEKLPKILQQKIYPLGLCFGVRSPHQKTWRLFLLGILGSNFGIQTKLDRLLLRRWKTTWHQQWRHWKFIRGARLLSRFQSFTKAQKDLILFQTRCFEEKNQDIREIHQQRYHLIKLLQQEFPNQFRGGFIPDHFFLEKFKDAVSNVPSAPEEYLDVLKSAKIVIYTRGLANSPAWKMPEYLSQGKIIIAEPLTTELPVALENEVHLLYFHNDAEFITQINRVLTDEALGNRLSANARAYFETHVSPEKNVNRILQLMQ
ncbi:MAG: glycosyltransferase [Mesonia sp.]|uniref:glycosyltransferase n=1 Tax=Mesonia sp. TaxID=1960830 RepID=UPI003241D514